MKKILAILVALLAALAVQTQVFADGELLPQTAETQSETSNGAVVLAEGSIEHNGINYTVLSEPDGGETGEVEVGPNLDARGAITIPATITDDSGNSYTVISIGEEAFLRCSDLTSVNIPDSVTSIGNDAFWNCSGLTSVNIPDSVTSIGSNAFEYCSYLTSVTIPGSVTSIGDYAFSECCSLTSVTIPGSVTSIGGRAFGNCTELTSVTFEGADPPEFGSGTFTNCSSLNTIIIPAGANEEDWKTALQNAGLDITDVVFERSKPDPTPDPTPTTPPADTNTAAEPASAPTVQQMETAERPDPQDVEATERYNFWMGVKADLRAAADGKTLRVHVPADYTNMPASVMEQIRLLDADVTVDLRWSGERLTITPATAQRKTALKAFWTFAQLCELYAQ